jgi:hypothetical protein
VCDQFYLEMQKIRKLDGDDDKKRRASVELARRVYTDYMKKFDAEEEI